LEAYFNALPPGALEAETIQGMRIHQRHLERILGENLLVGELETVHLQEYVNKRAREKGLRGKVTTTTIKKGIITLRTVWNWGVASKMLQGRFPNKGLKFPKSKEKPPFQTWAEIGRKVGRGVSNQEEQELWDALFLTVLEIDLLMKHVKANALQPFIYPMFCFAAHTGARRAEMLRSQVHDVDFEESFITLRERKKSHDATTTRRVPMSSFLAGVLKEWMTHHPGGSHTFCQTARVTRSKTTRSAPLPITPDEAHDHFKRTLADSKWARLRGWHVLRHSFISNLAAKGVDERLIDAFAGHTSEVRKRYIHLLPNVAQAAVKSVFG
jgi:integrase